MDAELTDKTILITGASGGIGQATARAFAAEGCGVALHYHTNREPIDELVAELSVPTLPVQADLSNEAETDRMFQEIFTGIDRLDGIVVNAGIWIERETPLHEMSLDQWRQTMDADLTSVFLTCRGFLRHVAASPRDEASIVLVGSTAALFGEAGHADYAAAKAGMVHGLLPSLKNEIVRLASRGRVNAVCPGWTATPMAAGGMQDAAAMERVFATMPMKKVGQPEDVASAIVFLSSAKLAGHLSGTIMPIAGGMEGRVVSSRGEE